jgi:hypothetical protein
MASASNRGPVAGLLMVLVATGCSERDTRGCDGVDYAKYQARSNPSFRSDVQPTLAISCALSTACHGVDRGMGPLNHPLLGPKAGSQPDQAMLGAIIADLRAPAERAPALARVAPGKPGESFLMKKLEGTLSCPGIECPRGCGARMPMLGAPLSDQEISAIRDWIQQGAQDN